MGILHSYVSCWSMNRKVREGVIGIIQTIPQQHSKLSCLRLPELSRLAEPMLARADSSFVGLALSS